MLAESTCPIRSSAKADQDLGALLRALRRIALVLVEMGDQLLLPGRAHAPQAFSGALRGSDRTRAFRNGLGAGRGGGFGGDRFRRGGGLHRGDLRDRLPWASSESFGATTRSGSSVSVGVSLGSSGFLHLGLLLGNRGRGDRRIGVRTRRQVGRLQDAAMSSPVRSRSQARRGRIVGIVVAADARPPALRRRDEVRAQPTACENPQPPGRSLLRVEVGHRDHVSLGLLRGLGLCRPRR